jgi:glycosyltransferase involved in cell wall biosynthesis
MTLLTLADFLSLERAGGLGRVAWESARALSSSGHESIVVEPRGETPSESDSISGVTVFRSSRPPHLDASEFLRPRTDLVDELVERFHPSAVITHGPLSGWTWARCGHRAKLRSLNVFHSAWGDEYRVEHESPRGWFGGRMRDLAERHTLRRADRYLTLSAFMANRLAELHRVPREKIHTVHGGVDLRHFSPGDAKSHVRSRLGWPQGVPTLIAVRNLRPRMGLDNLLEAVAVLLPRVPDLRLVLVGHGPLKEELSRRCRRLGLGDVVELVGFVDDADLPDMYRAADLAVVPTAALEGFGLVILEALACATPVVATPVGGIPEILTGLDRKLMSNGTSAADLAATLLFWLLDEQRLAEATARCRPYVESRFTWHRFAAGMVEALSDVH